MYLYIYIYIYLYVQIYIGRIHRHRVASPCLVVNKANELASERASGRSQQAATRAYLSAIDFSLVIDVEPLSTGGVLFLPHGTERMLRSVANGYLLPPARALRDAVLLNTSDKVAWGIYGGRGRRVGQKRVSPRIDARHRDTGSALGSNRRDNGILSLSLSLPLSLLLPPALFLSCSSCRFSPSPSQPRNRARRSPREPRDDAISRPVNNGRVAKRIPASARSS